MVSTFTIVMLGLATLLLIAAIMTGAIKYRKESNFMLNVIIGFVIYFMTQATFSIIASTVGTAVNGLVYFILLALNTIVVSGAVLFVMKRFAKIEGLSHRALTFGYSVLILFTQLFTNMSFFMASFAVNKNDLATAYPDMKPEDLQTLTKTLTEMSGLDVLQLLALVAITVVATAFCFKGLIKFLETKDMKVILLVLLVMIGYTLIPELIAVMLGSQLLTLPLFLAGIVGIVILDKKSL